jgi:hypothetical protein
MPIRPATAQEIIDHYENREGWECRIGTDGRVFLRPFGEENWYDGGWVSYYAVDENGHISLPGL